MRTSLAFLVATLFHVALAGNAPGQSGRVPVTPRPAPISPRPSSAVPRTTPVVPHSTPVNPHPTTAAGHGTTRFLNSPDYSGLSALAASTVTMMAPEYGPGALVTSSTLVARGWKQVSDPNAPRPNVAVAAPMDFSLSAASPPPSDGKPEWIIPTVLGLAAVGVGLVVAVGRSARAAAARCRVRIVAVPPGEAPDHVRQAWVGLELPAAPGERGPAYAATEGVLSHSRESGFDGYAVTGAEAVQLLAAKAPDAAQWWRANAPHVLRNGYQFVFPVGVCERL